MINNLCETPWWSLWWHLIWDLFICWGARHDITWGHFMAMSGKYHIISGWMFQRFCSTIQLCIDQWIEGQSYMHSCILICGCIHLYMYIYIFWLISRFPQIILFSINLSKEKMDFSFRSPLLTWVLTAAAVFSGRDVVCWSLLMKQKRFYAVAAVRAMRMFKLPCSNLRFGATGCIAGPNIDFGWERFHFPFAFKSCAPSIFWMCLGKYIHQLPKKSAIFVGTIPHWDATEVSPSNFQSFFVEVIFLGANGLQQFALSADLSHQQGPGPLDWKVEPSLEATRDRHIEDDVPIPSMGLVYLPTFGWVFYSRDEDGCSPNSVPRGYLLCFVGILADYNPYIFMILGLYRDFP